MISFSENLSGQLNLTHVRMTVQLDAVIQALQYSLICRKLRLRVKPFKSSILNTKGHTSNGVKEGSSLCLTGRSEKGASTSKCIELLETGKSLPTEAFDAWARVTTQATDEFGNTADDSGLSELKPLMLPSITSAIGLSNKQASTLPEKYGV
ncbi:hypothetical protein PoB_004420600 [Plakobranchus ocellatus]|uniref:Uncharacterized protein n=1 Tax=Plakobranchus ocellatus TaxID=259542 RepID=A0AAV4BFT9_9GAST|nr:hypothetical protein PoB_004420600 [Plakobranchus ocellatus]